MGARSLHSRVGSPPDVVEHLATLYRLALAFALAALVLHPVESTAGLSVALATLSGLLTVGGVLATTVAVGRD